MIRFKKHKGSMSKGILIVFFIMVMFVNTFIPKITTIEGQDIQDSLHFANISTYKGIDKRTLGKDSSLIIEDPVKAFNDFKEALKFNMDLDNYLMPKSSSIIASKVTIKHFIIYNVEGNKVDIYDINSHGILTKTTKELTKGDIKTPNGYVVESTTVHTTISFKAKNVYGQVKDQELAVDTDIVNQNK